MFRLGFLNQDGTCEIYSEIYMLLYNIIIFSLNKAIVKYLTVFVVFDTWSIKEIKSLELLLYLWNSFCSECGNSDDLSKWSMAH